MKKNKEYIYFLNLAFAKELKRTGKIITLHEVYYDAEFTFDEKFMLKEMIMHYFKYKWNLDHISASHKTKIIFKNKTIQVYQRPDNSW